MELLNLYTKFEELKNCTKKKDKYNCLKAYQNDALFTFVLEFLLNTNKTTGISDAKLKKDLSNKQAEEKATLQELITYVVDNPTGKDNIVRTVQLFIEKQDSPAIKKFIQELITKKY